MKIALLSDIHSNLDALSSVISELGNCDTVFLLGDLIGYCAEPNQVIEAVKTLKPLMVIAGNHEYAVSTGDVSRFRTWHGIKAIEWTREQLTQENRQYVSSLPRSSSVELEGIRVSAYHGSPRDPLNEYVYPIMPKSILRTLTELARTDILLLGHSHIPLNVAIGSKLIVNPGSVGQPRDGDPRASYGIMEVHDGRVLYSGHRVNYDIDSAAKKVLENHLPGILADRLYFGF